MSHFKHVKISKHIIVIEDPQNVKMFLIEGKDKAMLIDTGYGVEDLSEYVEKLTKLPYEVLCTHWHGDHVLGMKYFDKSYLPSEEISFLEGEMKSKFVPLSGNKIFDLGGVTLHTMILSGHTVSCTTVLIEEERIIILGDACNTHTWMFLDGCSTIGEYAKYLADFKAAHLHKFDKVLFSHGETKLFDKTVIDECMELCYEILEGKDDKQPYNAEEIGFHKDDVKIAKKQINGVYREDGKVANIFYHVDKIRSAY